MPIEIKNLDEKTKEVDVYIYGEVVNEKWYDEDVTPKEFQELEKLDVDLINVYINSPGGNVHAGISIGTILERHKALVRATVDGIAASISSVILQKADERLIVNNGSIMVHNPMTYAFGYAEDLMKAAHDLSVVKKQIVETYLEKSRLSEEDIITLMNNETLMTASQAVEYGFVDRIVNYKIKIENNAEGLSFNNVKIDKKYKNIYKNSAKIESFEPAPVVIDYSDIENEIAENELKLIESEVQLNELATNY